MKKNYKSIRALITRCFLPVLLVSILTAQPLSVLAYSVSQPAVGQSLTKTTGLNIRKNATTDSVMLSKLDPNAYIQIIGESGDFYKVIYNTSGSVGYCHKDYIRIISEVSGVVTTSSGDLNLRRSATTSSTILYALSNKTALPVLSVSDSGWVRVVFGTTTGYVYGKYFTTDATETETASNETDNLSAARSELTAYAKTFLGVLYEWGGDYLANSYSYGFDCSHFTYEVMKAFGLAASYRTSSNQYSWCTKITEAELLPGDLVFYKNSSGTVVHVTMYLGDGMIIGANGGTSSTTTASKARSSGACVKIQSIDYSSRNRVYGRIPGIDE